MNEPTQTEELAAMEECIAAWRQDYAEWLAKFRDEPYPHILTLFDLEDARDALGAVEANDDGR